EVIAFLEQLLLPLIHLGFCLAVGLKNFVERFGNRNGHIRLVTAALRSGWLAIVFGQPGGVIRLSGIAGTGLLFGGRPRLRPLGRGSLRRGALGGWALRLIASR